MVKASIQLPNGTTVVVEGTPEEVRKLLEFYGGTAPTSGTQPKKERMTKVKGKKPATQGADTQQPDLSEIINHIKNCDDAEAIETKILDRTSQVNRILLPLYIVHEYLDNRFKLTSGEVSQVTKDLGIPVQTPNASTTLSGTASKYVIGDKIRKKGQAVRYELSRRGVKYMSNVLRGTEDGQ